MFRFKLKAIEAHKAWLKNPEVLENCSTGLHFPSEHVENSEVASEAHCSVFSVSTGGLEFTYSVSHLQEKVMPLKSLPFYAADA